MARFSLLAIAPFLFASSTGAFSFHAGSITKKTSSPGAVQTMSPNGVTPLTSKNGLTKLNEMLTQTELPEKLYFGKEKETPKILGGVKIGLRKLVVVTGASSGLGLKCASTLAKTGKYYVIMACRDTKKAKKGRFLLSLQDNPPLLSCACA